MEESKIFARLVAEQDPTRRAQCLDDVCDGNEDLKVRLQKLLAAHENPRSFIDDPWQVDAHRNERDEATATFGTAGPIKPGATVGDYKLLQQIGEGGMGLVFMAEQTEPVKRRVALKLIKPGMDSRQVIARFEAERQALAMMDHPHIAKVLDAGTTEAGHPYFVMELVNGLPINAYCDQENMTTDDRLKLFLDVCNAVHHAHQKGIIHRDLKPTNILVAEFDGQPVPKVIDFGVAKATGSQLTDKTLFTEFGQIIGTIEYMSPEQARRNQLDVDTRTDIYSLGIVLYKLLTGETPFEKNKLREAAWDEMLRIIREEEPPLPSVKIDSSPTRVQIATSRGTEPSRLSSLVRGDLDWIVLKTLFKDRNRRYSSAYELARDIQRHLDQHPVTARPPSWMDRISKFTARNRQALLALVGVSLVALMIGYFFIQKVNAVSIRTAQLEKAIGTAQLAIATAQSSPIGESASWEMAAAHCQQIENLIDAGPCQPQTLTIARAVLNDFHFAESERELAVQIEEVVIQSATHPDLASWRRMEEEMRDFFRQHGFDFERYEPAEIGRMIHDDPSAVLWADLLELWIGTLGHMASLGGPPVTVATMQPWAEAMYIADDDPIRTGIRKFIYTPPRQKETLTTLMKEVDLERLSPRTLAWLGSCFGMVGDMQECDRIHQLALQRFPHDLMLTHDYGFSLYHQKRYQEAARMFHRCIAIRPDVAGIWVSLARTLEQLGEEDAARRAHETAKQLSQPTHKGDAS